MPYFALAWHIEELSDILLQVGVTIVAYGRLLSLFLNPLRNLPQYRTQMSYSFSAPPHVYRGLHMVRG